MQWLVCQEHKCNLWSTHLQCIMSNIVKLFNIQIYKVYGLRSNRFFHWKGKKVGGTLFHFPSQQYQSYDLSLSAILRFHVQKKLWARTALPSKYIYIYILSYKSLLNVHCASIYMCLRQPHYSAFTLQLSSGG